VQAQPPLAPFSAPPTDFQPTAHSHPLSLFILLMSLPLTFPLQLEATMTKSSTGGNVGKVSGKRVKMGWGKEG